MSVGSTPPVADDGRRALVVRIAIVVGVLVAVGVGVAGYVTASTPPFSVDEPRPEQPVAAGRPVHAGGQAGDVADGGLFVLAAEPAAAGQTIYTIGDRPVVDPAQGRWDGAVTPQASRAGAPVSVVVVRADPTCSAQLAEMGAADQGSKRFYGPLPGGCAAVATVPVRVTG